MIELEGRRAKTNSKGLAKLRLELHDHRATAKATSAICLPAKAKVGLKPSG